MAMLGDAHRPSAHGAASSEIHLRGLFDLRARQSRLVFDLLPARRIHARTVFSECVRVLRQELAIQH